MVLLQLQEVSVKPVRTFIDCCARCEKRLDTARAAITASPHQRSQPKPTTISTSILATLFLAFVT
jgi:hypothetical protein